MNKKIFLRVFLSSILVFFLCYMDCIADNPAVIDTMIGDFVYYLLEIFFFGVYYSLMLVVCVLPYGLSFCDQWNNKFSLQYIIRKGPCAYITEYLCKSAFFAGLTGALGFLWFYLFLAWFKLPIFSVNRIDGDYIPYFSLLENSPVGYLLLLLLGIFLFCFTSMMFSGIIAVKFSNKYYTLLSGYFLLSIIKITSGILKFPDWLRIDLWFTLQVECGSPMYSIIIMLFFSAIVTIAAILISTKLLERRLEHGED